jgi:hypothetical protein
MIFFGSVIRCELQQKQSGAGECFGRGAGAVLLICADNFELDVGELAAYSAARRCRRKTKMEKNAVEYQ